jgi:hypothetical protein
VENEQLVNISFNRKWVNETVAGNKARQNVRCIYCGLCVRFDALSLQAYGKRKLLTQTDKKIQRRKTER